MLSQSRSFRRSVFCVKLEVDGGKGVELIFGVARLLDEVPGAAADRSAGRRAMQLHRILPSSEQELSPFNDVEGSGMCACCCLLLPVNVAVPAVVRCCQRMWL